MFSSGHCPNYLSYCMARWVLLGGGPFSKRCLFLATFRPCLQLWAGEARQWQCWGNGFCASGYRNPGRPHEPIKLPTTFSINVWSLCVAECWRSCWMWMWKRNGLTIILQLIALDWTDLHSHRALLDGSPDIPNFLLHIKSPGWNKMEPAILSKSSKTVEADNDHERLCTWRWRRAPGQPPPHPPQPQSTSASSSGNWI